MQKRILAIHDISCIGKCSLTVALPVISAAGIETSIIPTAVLSTHTGGFTGYTYRDLTEDILPIADHWSTLDIKFDAIYTGFLGSFEQLDIVIELCKRFKKKDTLLIVDPVMADNGSLYATFTEEFPLGMKRLCSCADVITPNITEALLLIGEEYVKPPYTKEFMEHVMHELAKLGCGRIVITGACFDKRRVGAACFDAQTGATDYIMGEHIEGSYHGTGDVFASALSAALVKGCTLGDAAQIAVDFTIGSIKRTLAAHTDVRYGVNFEAGLAGLLPAILASTDK